MGAAHHGPGVGRADALAASQVKEKGGGGTSGSAGGWGVGGTVVGIPIHFGTAGRHELRLGLGIMGGLIGQHRDNAKNGRSNGPFLVPEVYYLYRFNRYLALQVGLDLYISIVSAGDYALPDPVVTGFAGLRF